MRYAAAQGGIDFQMLRYALNKKDEQLLRQIAESTLPFIAEYDNYFNGRPVNMPYWVSHGVRRLADEKVRTSLLTKRSAMRSQGSLGHSSAFERPGRFVLVRSKSYKSTWDISLSINVCHHLLGGDCGEEATVKAARAWFERLPKDCPDAVRQVYDDIVCRLAIEYARDQDQEIFFGLDGSGALDWAKALQMIGVRSVEKRGWLKW
jgi:hypothetical protein